MANFRGAQAGRVRRPLFHADQDRIRHRTVRCHADGTHLPAARTSLAPRRPDRAGEPARQRHDPTELPFSTLQVLLPSRYCEVDSELLGFAWNHFGNVAQGTARVQAICDFVHLHLTFNDKTARPTRTALDGYREQEGVCRDFTHLAITLCRCMNIPARHTTGYLGDIGIAPVPGPMDFSAWFEVFLGDRWYTFAVVSDEVVAATAKAA